MTVVLPAPLRPTSATTDPPAAATLKSRTTGRPSRYSNSTFSKRISPDARGVASARPVGLVVFHCQNFEHALHGRQRALQLGKRIDDVPDWVEKQERVPLEGHDVADGGAAAQVQIAAVPDDGHVDHASSRFHEVQITSFAAMGEQLLAQHGVAAAHVVEQLVHFAAERANHANAGKCLAHAAVDSLPPPCGRSGRSVGRAWRR